MRPRRSRRPRRRRPSGSRPPEQAVTKQQVRPELWLLAFLAAVCAVYVLFELREILFPLILALLISLGFRPMMRKLSARKVPVALSILLVLLIVVGSSVLLSTIVVNGVEEMVAAAPAYEEKLDRLLGKAAESVRDATKEVGLEGYEFRWQDTIEVSSLMRFGASSVGGVVSLTGNIFLALLYLVFLLLGTNAFPGKIQQAFRPDLSVRINKVLESVDTHVRRYLVAKTIISLVTATLVTIILLAFGVDFALFLGLVTFFLNFIPNIGSFIATAFPGLVALIQFESFGQALLIILLLVVVQSVMGNFIEPKLMGERLDLSPLAILLALIFWGWLWGIWGMLLAVPITSLIKIICESIEPLKPFGVLLGSGRVKT
ncbi:MAG: AI-2E family transporter [Bacteroidota bacterium]